ncbi:MAG TPA: IS481 family transposase [Acidobacteriaceae bacterium]|nr:IS481 family transposase [Acidobacteriaceae bacterium]
MAWRVSGVVDQRRKFVEQFESGDFTMAELCRLYEISRQSGHKWVNRIRAEGDSGLANRSRAPRSHPNQTSAEIEQQLLLLRRQHKTWGPRKLLHRLQQTHPKTAWPAASTIGTLLKREGLSAKRPERRKVPPYTQPFQDAERPNQLWCGDFKGWFLTRDHQRIDPLTISDATSRYLLRCQAVEKTNTAQVMAIYEAAFREYGLPEAMRTDNGPPFASRAIAGISVLSLFWMKLGIIPERIAPGHPEQNGRHERIHRTLKAETANPPAAHRRAQQAAFLHFQFIYNQKRPHEALGMKTPASCYEPSPRPYPSRLPEPHYDTGLEVRRVQASGCFKWKGNRVFISEVLRNEPIGFEPIEEDFWLVYFAAFPIAVFDSYRAEISELPDQRPGTQGRK